MSREIEYRALKDDISNCNFVHGLLVLNVLGGKCIQTTDSTKTNTCHSVIENTISEKTPFPDTEGKPIYEGDQLIDLDVELEEGVKLEETKQQVYWCDRKGAWMLDHSFKQDKGSGEFLYKELRDFRFKVVGNIYQSNN